MITLGKKMHKSKIFHLYCLIIWSRLSQSLTFYLVLIDLINQIYQFLLWSWVFGRAAGCRHSLVARPDWQLHHSWQKPSASGGLEPFSMCCQAVRTPASVSLGWVAAWWESAALEAANLALVILLLTKAGTTLVSYFRVSKYTAALPSKDWAGSAQI